MKRLSDFLFNFNTKLKYNSIVYKILVIKMEKVKEVSLNAQLISKTMELVEHLMKKYKGKLPDPIKMEIDDVLLHLFRALKDAGFYLDYDASVEILKILTMSKRSTKKKYVKEDPLAITRLHELIELYREEVEKRLPGDYEKVKKEFIDLLANMVKLLKKAGYKPSNDLIINIFKIYWCQ